MKFRTGGVRLRGIRPGRAGLHTLVLGVEQRLDMCHCLLGTDVLDLGLDRWGLPACLLAGGTFIGRLLRYGLLRYDFFADRISSATGLLGTDFATLLGDSAFWRLAF